MAEVRYFCPECGAIDLNIHGEGLVDSEGLSTATASCPNCSWSGQLKDTVGAATTERFFDIEKVGEILMRVLSTRAAGPLVQVLEYLGLIPRMAEYEDVKGAEAAVQYARDYAMREIMTSALESAFNASMVAQEVFKDWLYTNHPELAVEKYGPKSKSFPADREKRKVKTKQQKASRRKNRG